MVVQDKEKGPPLIVQKSDGGYGYATTDMAAIRHRLQDEKGEWLIYVTDMGQAPHFEAIFAGAEKAGFIKQLPSGRLPRLDHVGFGVVLGEDGKRIATRSGEVSLPLLLFTVHKIAVVLAILADASVHVRLPPLRCCTWSGKYVSKLWLPSDRMMTLHSCLQQSPRKWLSDLQWADRPPSLHMLCLSVPLVAAHNLRHYHVACLIDLLHCDCTVSASGRAAG